MLAHTRTGSGEPVVLLHGITHRRQGWDPVVPLLAEHREVIALDLPDHGESPDLPADYDGATAPLTTLVEQTLAELGVERPHVVGNSLGGLMALEMGARGTARSVTALSPAGFWSWPGRLWARGVLSGAHAALGAMGERRARGVLRSPAGRLALAGLVLAHPVRQDPDQLYGELAGLATPRASFRTMLASLDRWSLPDTSAVPTTVGWGTRDLLLPRRQVARVRAVLPAAKVYLLPGCGHVPMGDDPDLVADLVLAATRPR